MTDPRKIYVDLDDVLCETAREFVSLLERIKGRTVNFDQMTSFDLGVSFGLDPIELSEFMIAAHDPKVISLLKPVDGAVKTLETWQDKGFEIHVVTGRPPETLAASRKWLDYYAVPHTSLTFVNKYDRNAFSHVQIPLSRLWEFDFCFAVEDSPHLVEYLAKTLGIYVALFDRPWNRGLVPENLSAGKVTRCNGWNEVMRTFTAAMSDQGA